MSARILVFPKKALVRTRALRLEKQRKEQKRYVQKLVRTKANKVEKEQKAVKSTKAKRVRTYCAHARGDGNGKLAYLKTTFRQDLKAVGSEWRVFALQLWSALHPDPNAKKLTHPVVDAWRYAGALLERIDAGTFIPPPQVAQARRDQGRAERRQASATRRQEARRMADVTAALARGEYPGLG